jgi:hypothetical protein
MRIHPNAMLTTFALGAAAVPAVAQSGWTNPTPVVHPSARVLHALAFDAARATTVLFGGANGTLPLGDTWEWNGLTWTTPSTAHSPPARSGHALAYDLCRARIVLFGGHDGNSERNDTWEYDGADWMQLLPVHAPAPRLEMRMAHDLGRCCTVLFGGYGSLRPPFSYSLYGDTWKWDGVDWTQLATSTSPSARASHAMTYDFAQDRIVLCGGDYGPGPGSVVPIQDTWLWDGTSWSPATRPPIPARVGFAYDWNRGVAVETGLGATFVLDGGAWRQDPRAGGPSSRQTPLVNDFVRGCMVCFGGSSGFPANLQFDDTWEYDPRPLARWSAFGGGCAGAVGTPSLRPAAGSLPVLGSTFVLELGGLPAAAAAAISIGFSSQQWSGHALPWDIGALGMPGCVLQASPDFLFFVTAAGGSASLPWPLPLNTSLAGTQFFDQGFVFEPGANALGAIVSNAGGGVVGPF